MYQDIVDELVLPFGADDVQGFFTKNDAFYIQQKTGEIYKAFDLVEDLHRSEFVRICKMIADKLLSV
jgi:hypothetical protein